MATALHILKLQFILQLSHVKAYELHSLMQLCGALM